MRNRPQSAQRRRDAKLVGAPKVGIFWQYGKRLIVAGTPLAKAEAYGESKTFSSSHLDYWAKLQHQGSVPRETEYEECPRGRAIYNTRTQQFSLMADRCILRNKRLVSAIKTKLNLPRGTKVLSDDHYRCPKCAPKRTANQEDHDWAS